MEADSHQRQLQYNFDLTTQISVRHVISYSPCEGHIKDVVYFVAKAENDAAMMPQECEVKELIWKPFSEAGELLTYDLEKQTLEAAYDYLLKG